MKLNNKYFLLRHGHAESNKLNLLSSWPETFYNPLTKKGIDQVKKASKIIEKNNIDFIISSDVLRAKQTAEIFVEKNNKKIKFDNRLREYNFGKFNGTFLREFKLIMPDRKYRFSQKIKGVENYKGITKRMWSFFTEINKKYKNKNILIVSHQVPISLLLGKINNFSEKEIFKKYFDKNEIKNGQIIEIK